MKFGSFTFKTRTINKILNSIFIGYLMVGSQSVFSYELGEMILDHQPNFNFIQPKDIKKIEEIQIKKPNINIMENLNTSKVEELDDSDIGIGDIKPIKKDKTINKSNYNYDYNIYYDLYSQYERLKQFEDHPKISEQGKKYVKNTLISLENFIDFIENNKLNERFVIVNIPSFNLIAFDENHLPVLESKVVVGARGKKTPFETINITSLKYNPDWTPTKNMIKNHIFKNGEININYLKNHGLKAYLNKEEINYEDIDFENENNYTFKQPSGVDNALGVLKFETNSRHNIYLHDTNQPYLFNNKIRANSSGCIRVQNYLDLASWLYKNNSEESIEEIVNNINKNKTYYQRVKSTSVYFTYFQAFVNENNKLITLNNIYKLTDEEIENMFMPTE